MKIYTLVYTKNNVGDVSIDPKQKRNKINKFN